MKKLILAVSLGVALGSFGDAVPVVSNATMVQPSGGREVTITYTLSDAPAVITLDIQTNATAAVAATSNQSDPKSPYGACAHVTRNEPAGRTCGMLRTAGIGWVRGDFDWRQIERKPGEWDFAAFDRIVGECEAAGVQLLPILGYSVPWADPAHEHLDAWGEYVKRVVEHYGRRLPVLEVWNEQNSPGFWKNPNPTNYLAVLRRAYEVAKARDSALRVSFGGTAGVPFAFIEEVYKLGGAKFFDIVCVHPYTCPDAPEGRVDYNLAKLRALMAKYGDAEKPIWITEMGWPTPKMHVSDGDARLLRAGLRAADPAKKCWRTLYVPSRGGVGDCADVAAALCAMLPEGSTVEPCAGAKLAERLVRGGVDAIIFPFDESYCADGMDAVVDFVKAGGTLVDFGGMPLWDGYRADAAGRMVRVSPDDGSGWRDRQRLRIHERAWWMDSRYPDELCVAPTDAAGDLRAPGCPKTYKSGRFFSSHLLRPGDEFVPLLAAQTNGIEVVAAAVYKFNSDFKGRVVVSGLMGGSLRSATSEAQQALMYARALGIAFAEGVEAFFCYELREPDCDPNDAESYFGIVHNNFAPKPAYGAYMTFIDRRPVGSVQKKLPWRDEKAGRYFPQWKRPDGRDAGMVWTTGASEKVWLAFAGEWVEFHDVSGLRVRPERDGKKYLVPLSESPIYFTGGELVK